MAKFKRNDLIQKDGSMELALVQCASAWASPNWYFVRWMGSGDSMLLQTEVDEGYYKVGEFDPNNPADQLMFNGHVTFKGD